MRGTKAKLLRKAAHEWALTKHVSEKTAYKLLKKHYKTDPINRKKLNAAQA